ncbi:MAG TPA: LTA synthase family protein, partial [Saprospiraceae bacterium]|nr:LTA synthase family protein [Saprospiraceae bacterium]
SMLHGLYMDLAMTAYLLVIPFLLFVFQKWIPLRKIMDRYHYAMIVIMALLFSGDAPLYREWGFRLDKTAFNYITDFREAGSFISISNILYYLVFAIGHSVMGVYLYRKIVCPATSFSPAWLYVVHLLALPALVIPMRGGFGIIPMNPGKVYFTNSPFPNHAALNAAWNLMYSLSKAKKKKSETRYMEEGEAARLVDSLYSGKNAGTEFVLRTSRPKILFLLMESFSAKLINRSYRDSVITPRLNEWIKTGLYWDSVYATGDRTEMGLASTLSAFPAQPQSSIVQFPAKTEKLPSLIRDLKKAGYQTAFYYGGDASFASMNSFLFNGGCDVIIDKSHFPSESYNAKWGVHDHLVFERLYEDIQADSTSFFKIGLSLSSHPPYEIPDLPLWSGPEEETLFLNAAHYTDHHLGVLLDKLSKLPVWNELLIVLVADHGCRFPGNDPYHVPEKFRIPLWFGGGAVLRDSLIRKVGSQNDIPSTVLAQLKLPHSEFRFSQNLLSVNHSGTAYYAFNNGFGWVETNRSNVYSNDTKKIISSSGPAPQDTRLGPAFLQMVLDRFNAL